MKKVLNKLANKLAKKKLKSMMKKKLIKMVKKLQEECYMNQKGKIAQLFCKHENSDWYRKESKFQMLHGERKYQICNNCGKVIDKIFKSNEDENYM